MEKCYDHESEEDFSTKTPENIGTSPLSGDEEAYIPSPRRSGRGARKRVVTVPIAGGDDGYRSRGEVYPPPDSWSWRKYGQKPIKGSPYPRGYYRCSSSKGCPAKKQVERSRHDPTAILITYSSDHNHTLSTAVAAKNYQQNYPAKTEAASSGAATSTSPSSSTATTPPANIPPEESTVVNPSARPDISYYAELASELGWLCEMGSTMMDGTTLVGPMCAAGQAEMERFMPIGEEDELLFGDLGDLPEYSLVFGRLETPDQDNFS